MIDLIMSLEGTLVNSALVLCGGVIGFLAKKGIPSRFEELIMGSIGLITMVMGVQYTLATSNFLWIIVSLVVGAIIGEWIDIDRQLQKMSQKLESKFKMQDSRFVEGMMTATLLFCVGAMAIMGALDSGLKGEHTILYTKGIMDGISAVLLTSSIGIGVIFSVIPMFIYQGGITLLAEGIAPYLSDLLITEVSAVGGILLVGLGISILGIKRIKVANLLPAMFVMAIIYLIQG